MAGEAVNPTERFSDRVQDYRLYRPGYPRAVTDLMRDACGLKPAMPVADIGSGTGIFTRLLLEAGFVVTAVEPNAAMRQAAEEDLRLLPGFHSVAAPAEETGLPGGAFAAITVAQAFHWFDAERARLEFQRLLRPDGWVFLIRNHRKATTTAFNRDYDTLLQAIGEPYHAVAHRDEEAAHRGRQSFFQDNRFQRADFDNPHAMDWPALRGRFLSVSYAPAEGDPRHHAFLLRLEDIFHRHSRDGQVTFDQTTEVFYGRLSAG